MKGRLQGKRCVITGAARGIGAAAARLFAQEGARVVLLDLKDELGSQVVAQIVSEGGAALYQNCDVTHLRQVSAAVDAAVQFFGGGIDVLFNNAGTCIEGDVEKLSEEDWDRTFAINVKSMFLCSKIVVPIMRKSGGSIINMGSESGLIGFPMHPAYCASKGAVLNLTRSMALGYAKDHIRVNCICPGTIPTPLYHEFTASLPNKAEVEAMLTKEHPLGLGTEEDIAYAALYLASDESRYMTGSPLIIDGGYTAK